VEATATIAACLNGMAGGWRADWKALATRAFTWFLGSNDLSVALVDPHTGSCRDGLHPIVPMKIAAASRLCAICLGLQRFASLRASTPA